MADWWLAGPLRRAGAAWSRLSRVVRLAASIAFRRVMGRAALLSILPGAFMPGVCLPLSAVRLADRALPENGRLPNPADYAPQPML